MTSFSKSIREANQAELAIHHYCPKKHIIALPKTIRLNGRQARPIVFNVLVMISAQGIKV